jgi:hypothetical protein
MAFGWWSYRLDSDRRPSGDRNDSSKSSATVARSWAGETTLTRSSDASPSTRSRPSASSSGLSPEGDLQGVDDELGVLMLVG